MTRNKTFFKETFLNYIYKAIFIVINFFLVPLTITFLGNIKYGAWVIILSIISWANITDFGLGNGLRNKIAEVYGINHIKEIQEYMSTTFYMIIFISTILTLVGIGIFYYFDFSFFINQPEINYDELRLAFIITLIGFSINFVLGTYRSVSNGLQKSSWVAQSQAMNALLLLLGIYILLNFFTTSLIVLSILYALASIISNLILATRIILFDNYFIPKFNMAKVKRIREVFTIGFYFFILQFSGLILFSSDNVIIGKYLGMEDVTVYTIIDKVFLTGNTLFSILLVALWSAVTKANAQNDFKWIKQIIKKLKLIVLVYAFGVVLVGLNFDYIVSIWIGQDLVYTWDIRVVFILYSIFVAFGAIYVNVVNGLGELKLQMYLTLIAAIVNIPLSILLGVYLEMGLTGIKLATFLALLPLWFILPFQVKKIMGTKEISLKSKKEK